MANTQREACPLCGTGVVCQHMGYPLMYWYDCPHCGKFGIDHRTKVNIGAANDRELIFRLSALVRSADLAGHPWLLCEAPHRVTDVEAFRPISPEELLAQYWPRTVTQRLDQALLNIAQLSQCFGDKVQIDPMTGCCPFLLAANPIEISYTIESLKKSGFIDARPRAGAMRRATIQSTDVIVTPRGWSRVEEMRRAISGGLSEQVFVAMWFGNEKVNYAGKSSLEFCNDAYVKGFRVAIEQAGYEARRIDFKEFNGDIVTEIFAEIKKSRCLIADLTGHRAGVYYEAGYAIGLGCPVILSCHRDALGDAHFDIRNYNMVVWSTTDELRAQLKGRMVATIGVGPRKCEISSI